MTLEEFGALLREKIARGDGGDNDELHTNRENALDYYFNRARGDELAGRSQVQDGSVADMIQAILANVMPVFTGDSPASFEPDSEQDEDSARVESITVNHTVMHASRGYVTFYEAIHDALLLRNAIIRVWVEETTDESETNYKALTQLEEFSKVQPTFPDEIVEVTSRSAAGVDEGTGEKLTDVTITRTRERKILKIAAVPPEQFVYDSNHGNIFIHDIAFCAERQILTQTELLALGISQAKIDTAPVFGSDFKTDATARKRDAIVETRETSDESMQARETWLCYALADLDGSGMAKLHKTRIDASQQVMSDELVQTIPYAMGATILVPHETTGVSVYDRLRTVQDVKTKALRSWVDNFDSVNNARLGVVEGMANLDDALNSRPGGIIRLKSPDALVPLPVADVGASTQALMDYMDRTRSERAGASLDLASAQAQIQVTGSLGIDRQFSAREQLANMQVTLIVETLVRTTYLLVHQIMREEMAGELQVRNQGQWVTADPSQWQKRERVNLRAGMSATERQQKANMLQQVIQLQQSALEQGLAGELTDATKLHNALIDWGHAANINSPEQYWINPASPEAQQAAQQKQQAQQEQSQQLVQLQLQIAQMSVQLETSRIEQKASTDRQNLMWKFYNTNVNAEVDQAKIIADKRTELEKNAADNERGNGESSAA